MGHHIWSNEVGELLSNGYELMIVAKSLLKWSRVVRSSLLAIFESGRNTPTRLRPLKFGGSLTTPFSFFNLKFLVFFIKNILSVKKE